MNDGGPAFPHTFQNKEGFIAETPGMSLRDWFAGMAAQGLLAGDPQQNLSELQISELAYRQADALIAQRQKEAGK